MGVEGFEIEPIKEKTEKGVEGEVIASGEVVPEVIERFKALSDIIESSNTKIPEKSKHLRRANVFKLDEDGKKGGASLSEFLKFMKVDEQTFLNMSTEEVMDMMYPPDKELKDYIANDFRLDPIKIQRETERYNQRREQEKSRIIEGEATEIESQKNLEELE